MVRWTFSCEDLELPQPRWPTHKQKEGSHNRLMKMAQKVHPNLFEFIEVIQKKQAAAEVTIEQLSGAGRVRAKEEGGET